MKALPLLFGIFWFLCSGALIQAQSHLHSANFGIELLESDPKIRVESSFKLIKTDSSRTLPVKIIGKEKVEILSIKAYINEREVALSFKPLNSRVDFAEINLERLAIMDSLINFKLQYFLAFEESLEKKQTIQVPVIFPNWKPNKPETNAFIASIRLEKGKSLRPIFPAMTWKKKELSDAFLYSFELQVLPAWVKFQVFKGSPSLFSLELLVDIGVFVLMIIVVFWVWKKMQTS